MKDGYLRATDDDYGKPCSYGLLTETFGFATCGRPAIYRMIGSKILGCSEHADEMAASDASTYDEEPDEDQNAHAERPQAGLRRE